MTVIWLCASVDKLKQTGQLEQKWKSLLNATKRVGANARFLFIIEIIALIPELWSITLQGTQPRLFKLGIRNDV